MGAILWPEVDSSRAREGLPLGSASLRFLEPALPAPVPAPGRGAAVTCVPVLCLREEVSRLILFSHPKPERGEHGVFTPPQGSAAVRRLEVVTDSVLSRFPHSLPGNVAARGRDDAMVSADPHCSSQEVSREGTGPPDGPLRRLVCRRDRPGPGAPRGEGSRLDACVAASSPPAR